MFVAAFLIAAVFVGFVALGGLVTKLFVGSLNEAFGVLNPIGFLQAVKVFGFGFLTIAMLPVGVSPSARVRRTKSAK